MKPQDWSRIPAEQMNPSLVRRVLHTEGATLARLEMKQGGSVPVHSHANEQVTLVQSGRLRFYNAEMSQEVGPGGIMELAPHVPHGVEVLEDAVVIDLFVPRREDWIRGDDSYLRSR